MSPLTGFESSRLARWSKAAALTALAAAPSLACGTSDEDVFANGTAGPTGATSATSSATSASGSPTTASPVPEVAAGVAEPSRATEPTVAAGSSTSDMIAVETAISFTYAAEGGGGRVRNPYVAVWIETPAGDLVRTVSLWFEQSRKGTRWLGDLSGWYRASTDHVAAGGTDAVDVVSSATRVAGTYSVLWDGLDEEGNPVAEGEYVVYVEAAREHGPHSVTSAALTVGSGPVTVTLPDDGELSSLTASVQP